MSREVVSQREKGSLLFLPNSSGDQTGSTASRRSCAVALDARRPACAVRRRERARESEARRRRRTTTGVGLGDLLSSDLLSGAAATDGACDGACDADGVELAELISDLRLAELRDGAVSQRARTRVHARALSVGGCFFLRNTRLSVLRVLKAQAPSTLGGALFFSLFQTTRTRRTRVIRALFVVRALARSSVHVGLFFFSLSRESISFFHTTDALFRSSCRELETDRGRREADSPFSNAGD